MNVFWSGFSAGALSMLLPSLVFLALMLHQAPRLPAGSSGSHFGTADGLPLLGDEEVAG